MKKISKIVFVIGIFLSNNCAFASLSDQVESYPSIVRELVSEGLFFSAVPYVKEYLIKSNRSSSSLDDSLESIIPFVGVKQFEPLKLEFLKRSSSASVHYILAKKMFRVGKYEEALRELDGTIPSGHSLKPFALHLEGAITSILKRVDSSVSAYQACVEKSIDQLSDASTVLEKRQLEINRDYCIVGIPRTQFGMKQYENAYSTYLDLPKESMVWPEILVEEAWNSFYLRDYNRTLGKLVTYKAPILKYVFNPEIEVLTALTYMELCLWEDALKSVDSFYNNYMQGSQYVKNLLNKKGNDYKYFYLLAKAEVEGKFKGPVILENLLIAIHKDPAYIELMDAFNKGSAELKKIETVSNGAKRSQYRKNTIATLLIQRNIVGSYVLKRLETYSRELDKSLQGMSYIKLEILSKRKNDLYQALSDGPRSRGDIIYLQRTDKQYFWNFIGEFWADELGDYVFSLKSECK